MSDDVVAIAPVKAASKKPGGRQWVIVEMGYAGVTLGGSGGVSLNIFYLKKQKHYFDD